jgi:hypothetical protein
VTDLVVRSVPDGLRFDVRVTPRASRTAVDGVRDGRLVVRVTAPPVDAAANAAVIALLADALGVAKRKVTLVTGERSRTKGLVVAGVTELELRQRLDAGPHRRSRP